MEQLTLEDIFLINGKSKYKNPNWMRTYKLLKRHNISAKDMLTLDIGSFRNNIKGFGIASQLMVSQARADFFPDRISYGVR